MSKKRPAVDGEFHTDPFINVRWVEGDQVVEYRDGISETFLAGLRVGIARLKLNVTELEVEGVAVRRGLKPVEQAMADLDARGLLDWLFPDVTSDTK